MDSASKTIISIGLGLVIGRSFPGLLAFGMHEIALKVRAFRTQSYNICPSRQL